LTEEGKVTKSKGKQKKDKGKSKDSSSESVGLKDVNEIAMEEKQKISRDEGDVNFIDSSNTAQRGRRLMLLIAVVVLRMVYYLLVLLLIRVQMNLEQHW